MFSLRCWQIFPILFVLGKLGAMVLNCMYGYDNSPPPQTNIHYVASAIYMYAIRNCFIHVIMWRFIITQSGFIINVNDASMMYCCTPLPEVSVRVNIHIP